MLAAENGHISLVKFLIDKGASVCIPSPISRPSNERNAQRRSNPENVDSNDSKRISVVPHETLKKPGNISKSVLSENDQNWLPVHKPPELFSVTFEDIQDLINSVRKFRLSIILQIFEMNEEESPAECLSNVWQV